MNFTHYDLGQKQSGDIIEVTLKGSAANVRLMDSSNFQSYRNGKSHRYQGGLVTRSPYRLQVPSSGHWHVTVDMAGLRGSTQSSIRQLPRALPVAQEAPLASVPSLVQRPQQASQGFGPGPGLEEDIREYDVFISHASEDKAEVVTDLAIALRASGLRVWYDDFELKIGDSLRRKIDRGLANSKFGVIVLSRSFFSKGWTNYELDGLVTRAVSGEQILLPIWHNITKKEVMDNSPSLADKVARSTSTHTVEEIAKEICEVIRKS
ncbi:MAG: hypothetical protein JWP58_2074 [Hymenobacter sp.]|nr:hypothetical protein [Hymenobacter sp.]